MNYKLLIELVFIFSPLIFFIWLCCSIKVELTQEKIESVKMEVNNQFAQMRKNIDDEIIKNRVKLDGYRSVFFLALKDKND